jgi:signal transduction histidine kinase
MVMVMRERAEMLGGTLEIHAEPGNGTTVKAAVPLGSDENRGLANRR